MVRPVKDYAKAKRPARYKGRENEELTKEQWEAHLSDPEYAVLLDFENDLVKVRVEWTGQTSDKNCPFDWWDIYRVDIFTKVGDKWVRDPASKRDHNGNSALHSARQFLANYTDCEFDSGGGFHEVGNKLAPPDPNTASGADTNSFIGSW